MKAVLAVGAALAFGAAGAMAANKCTGADGRVVYQDFPCSSAAKGTEAVKTWDNTPGNYLGYQEMKEPSLKLTGPPQAKPLLDIYRRWIDAEKLATVSSRVALSGPAASLQSIQRELESVPVPECMAKAKAAFLELSAKAAAMVLAFMDKNEAPSTLYQLRDRPKLVGEFETAVERARCK